MSFLIKTAKPRLIFEGLRIASAAHGRQGHFFPECKPGPLPVTEEERIKAARKYNLLPEEYETYEEGSGHGDYPKLPFESVDSKDPWYPWDIDEFRRNYNEAVHAEMIILIPELISTDDTRPSKYIRALVGLAAFSAVGLGIILTSKYCKLIHPLCEKQYVTPGVTHYTFEPDYSLRIVRFKGIRFVRL